MKKMFRTNWKPLIDYVHNELGLPALSKQEIPLEVIAHMERQDQTISNYEKIHKQLKEKISRLEDKVKVHNYGLTR